MPSTIKIRVVQARDLPVMDRKSQRADSFVTIKFGDQIQKQRTQIAKKTVNPVWNESFRLELYDDDMLAEEPLEFKVWDKDFYSPDDAIGVVLIDLSPLLAAHEDAPKVIEGWFPLFDTLEGIRGSLYLSVKVESTGNVNVDPYDSNVPVFHTSSLAGHDITHVLGFVEELVVERDPEYHWRDTFRASRISNEARLLVFMEVSKESQLNISKKASELGGNCVLGYRHQLDLEGESGVISRAYGTACIVAKHSNGANLSGQRHHDPAGTWAHVSSGRLAGHITPRGGYAHRRGASAQPPCALRRRCGRGGEIEHEIEPLGGVPQPLAAHIEPRREHHRGSG
jgi:uncharacterized protein YbjQ (UPF0145 family)